MRSEQATIWYEKFKMLFMSRQNRSIPVDMQGFQLITQQTTTPSTCFPLPKIKMKLNAYRLHV